LKRSVLFHRNYHGLTGGHLKVRDYFQHIRSTSEFIPKIFFSPGSSNLADTPWSQDGAFVLERWDPRLADMWFLAGKDWLAVPEELRADPPVPVINLIQHTRHFDPSDIRYSFLRYPAVRICVSQEVEAGLRDTGLVRGPIYTIPNCLDFSDFPSPFSPQKRGWDFFIGALKAPEIGQIVATRLSDIRFSSCLTVKQVPRGDYLNLINESRVALLLPHEREGFYLPALEAMALEAVVVCPDCVGSRSFCIDEYNCLQPEYSVDALVMAATKALSLTDEARGRIVQEARQTALQHDISIERKAFLRILEKVDDLWESL
jgi:glycosyltransferase involved in cell wall biosynthesis